MCLCFRSTSTVRLISVAGQAVSGLLEFDPDRRWTAAQAAAHPFITQQRFVGSFEVSRRAAHPPARAPSCRPFATASRSLTLPRMLACCVVAHVCELVKRIAVQLKNVTEPDMARRGAAPRNATQCNTTQCNATQRNTTRCAALRCVTAAPDQRARAAPPPSGSQRCC